MNKDEYGVFLNKTLTILENAVNFLNLQHKHILSYHKMLGVQQKFEELDDDMKQTVSLDIMKVRTIIHYLKDGAYNRASENMTELKQSLYNQLYNIEPKNENNED